LDAPSAIRLHDLTGGYGGPPVLRGVSLEIPAGRFVGLVGPSGAGKTSILKAMLGTLPRVSGTVEVGGRPVGAAGPPVAVGYVPQTETVDWSFPVTVEQVVLMGRIRAMGRLPWPSRADRREVAAALATLGLAGLGGRHIRDLSGGQQQRVFLARALLQHGDVYLLDEPFTGVDVPTQGLLVDLFDDLKRQGKTIVNATHDLALAAASSDRVILLNRRVVADGPPASTMTADHLRRAFGGQAVVPFAGVAA